MDIVEIFGLGLILAPVKDLIASMKKSKTLTFMVILGSVFFVGFIFFLIYMASFQ